MGPPAAPADALVRWRSLVSDLFAPTAGDPIGADQQCPPSAAHALAQLAAGELPPLSESHSRALLTGLFGGMASVAIVRAHTTDPAWWNPRWNNAGRAWMMASQPVWSPSSVAGVLAPALTWLDRESLHGAVPDPSGLLPAPPRRM